MPTGVYKRQPQTDPVAALTNTNEVDIRKALKTIDERIALLQNIKVAIRHAWGIETTPEPLRGEEAGVRQVQHERQHQEKAAPKKASRKTGTGNRDMILAVLKRAGGPLSVSEIYARMVQRGWETTSKKPRELVGVTVRSMWEKGQLKRAGGDYELPSDQRQLTTNAAEVPETPVPLASNVDFSTLLP